MAKRPMSYRVRQMLKSASAKASNTRRIDGEKKTRTPRPITLAKTAKGVIES